MFFLLTSKTILASSLQTWDCKYIFRFSHSLNVQFTVGSMHEIIMHIGFKIPFGLTSMFEPKASGFPIKKNDWIQFDILK